MSSKKLGLAGLLFAFLVVLPLLVWAVSKLNFNYKKRAQTASPTTITCEESFSDNFNIDTGIPDPTIWEPATNTYIATDSGTLHMYVHAGVDSAYALRSINEVALEANFQIETDIKSFYSNPVSNNELATAELKAQNDTNNFLTIRWVKWMDSQGAHSLVNLYSIKNGEVTETQGASIPFDSTPRLKLVRSGQELKGFYDLGSGYIELPSISEVFTGSVKPTLFVYKRGIYDSLVDFDNFAFGCITEESPSPSPTLSPSPSPSPTPSPSPSPSPTPTDAPIVTATPTTPTSTPVAKVGDVNMDGGVNMIDIGIVIDDYDSTNPTNPRSDIDASGKVDLIDIGLIIDNYE